MGKPQEISAINVKMLSKDYKLHYAFLLQQDVVVTICFAITSTTNYPERKIEPYLEFFFLFHYTAQLFTNILCRTNTFSAHFHFHDYGKESGGEGNLALNTSNKTETNESGICI